MFRLLKVLVILTLLAGIGALGYGAYYLIIIKPQETDRREAARLGYGPDGAQPTPDPGTPDFEAAQAIVRERRFDDARAALGAFLTKYPDSPFRARAESLLGEVNVDQLFSGTAGPDKVEYIVQRGDVLDRVAHKTKSNPELIFRANSLDRIMLQIGQRLEVPQVDFSVEVHLGERKLVLINKGQFFKSYPILDFRPLPKKTAEIRTKVQEKQAIKDGKRVAFGSREYPESLRSLALAGQSAYTLTGRGDPQPGEAPPATGIGLAAPDAEELHTLLDVGTPVNISAD